MKARTGTAGWAIPRQVADRFPEAGSTLERYAARFDVAEINSSFHRPHRRSTYERWAASVPTNFRFAVKLPKEITHKNRLVDCEPLLARFAEEAGGLGDRRGPLLVQLPPSFAFDGAVADGFFALLAAMMGGPVVCEPRHASWFGAEAGALLAAHRVARVAADPASLPAAAAPGGWDGLAYFRLHGSPRPYWSAYDAEAVARWAQAAEAPLACGVETWVIFDNTASGSAAPNALEFLAR